MKLNSPFFKLCRSEGLAISEPKFRNKWQGWALAQNPLAYWNFNETTGPFADITGRSSSVVPGTGMTLGVSGYTQGSLAMKGLESLGTSGYATVSYTGAISGTFSEVTVEMIVQFNPFLAVPLGAAARRGFLLNTSTMYPLSIKLMDTSILTAGVTIYSAVDESYYTAQFSTGLDVSDLSKFYHLVIAANATTGNYLLYINGTPFSELIIIGDPTPAGNYVVTAPAGTLWFLCGTTSGGGVGSPHRMDELIIYDRCFTAEEVAMRFAQTGLENGYVVPE